jgi:23S rRNA pseudouridine2457 synthase
MLIAFNKPFGVVSQFSSDGSSTQTLAEFGFPRGVYPVGRLDADSEGLLILSDQPEWNARLLRPGQGHEREYWVQVEGDASREKLQRLIEGVVIQGRATLPARVRALEQAPDFPPRNPPVRFRKTVPDCWLSIIFARGPKPAGPPDDRCSRSADLETGARPDREIVAERFGAGRMEESSRVGNWMRSLEAELRRVSRCHGACQAAE